MSGKGHALGMSKVRLSHKLMYPDPCKRVQAISIALTIQLHSLCKLGVQWGKS